MRHGCPHGTVWETAALKAETKHILRKERTMGINPQKRFSKVL